MDGVFADFASAFREVEARVLGQLVARRVPARDRSDRDGESRAARLRPEHLRAAAASGGGVGGHAGHRGLLDHADADQRGRGPSPPRLDARASLGSVLHHAAAGHGRRDRAATDSALAGRAGIRPAQRARHSWLARRCRRRAAARLPCGRHDPALPRRDDRELRADDSDQPRRRANCRERPQARNRHCIEHRGGARHPRAGSQRPGESVPVQAPSAPRGWQMEDGKR